MKFVFAAEAYVFESGFPVFITSITSPNAPDSSDFIVHPSELTDSPGFSCESKDQAPEVLVALSGRIESTIIRSSG